MLLHEAWLTLGSSEMKAHGRANGLRIAAQAMRRFFIDTARTPVQGAARMRVYVEPGGDGGWEDWSDLVDWERAMTALDQTDPELAELIDLHAFLGLDFEEIAALRQQSERSVQLHWRSAYAFLRSL